MSRGSTYFFNYNPHLKAMVSHNLTRMCVCESEGITKI